MLENQFRNFLQYLKLFGFPGVPRKAVAEISKLETYRKGDLLWCMDGRANPWMDRNMVCCDAWMAEQTHGWNEKWLDCQNVHLSICFMIRFKGLRLTAGRQH